MLTHVLRGFFDAFGQSLPEPKSEPQAPPARRGTAGEKLKAEKLEREAAKATSQAQAARIAHGQHLRQQTQAAQAKALGNAHAADDGRLSEGGASPQAVSKSESTPQRGRSRDHGGFSL
jgi:hypothetical protein